MNKKFLYVIGGVIGLVLISLYTYWEIPTNCRTGHLEFDLHGWTCSHGYRP